MDIYEINEILDVYENARTRILIDSNGCLLDSNGCILDEEVLFLIAHARPCEAENFIDQLRCIIAEADTMITRVKQAQSSGVADDMPTHPIDTGAMH